MRNGDTLTDEQRAILDDYFKRYKAAPQRGRPREVALVKFRKRYGAVLAFHALRVEGIPQEDAELRVAQAFNVSTRAIWLWQRWVDQRFPFMRDSLQTLNKIFEGLRTNPALVHPQDRLMFLLHLVTMSVMSQQDAATITEIIDREPDLWREWVSRLIIRTWDTEIGRAHV